MVLGTPVNPLGITMDENIGSSRLELFRLLQLASSNLPVGGYTFSQGLEYAIEAGWLQSSGDIHQWIEQTTFATLTYSDLPLIRRQYLCLTEDNWQQSQVWNETALAIRETRELLLADTAMGEAMVRLAKGLGMALPNYLEVQKKRCSFTTLFSIASHSMGISVDSACAAFSWTQLENQVLAATKLLPLGQTQSQKLLFALSGSIHAALTQSLKVEDDQIGLSLPGLAMASAKHETQYSRLYRS